MGTWLFALSPAHGEESGLLTHQNIEGASLLVASGSFLVLVPGLTMLIVPMSEKRLMSWRTAMLLVGLITSCTVADYRYMHIYS